MKKIVFAGLATLAMPIVAFAQLENIENIATSIGSIINVLIPIVFALALLFFFWGLAMYIFGADHDKDKAKKTMIWGVVALFVMAAVWGLVNFLGDALGIDNDAAPDVSDLIPTP